MQTRISKTNTACNYELNKSSDKNIRFCLYKQFFENENIVLK